MNFYCFYQNLSFINKAQGRLGISITGYACGKTPSQVYSENALQSFSSQRQDSLKNKQIEVSK